MNIAILHIDDDPDLAEIVHIGLEHMGFHGEFINAQDVYSATAIIRSRMDNNLPLDLIIVDMNLPDGSGLEVIRSIKTNPVVSSIPVLVLSGETSQQSVADAYAFGANSYLPKSLDGAKFLHEINSLYDFWLQSAVLPHQRPDRFGFAISLKAQSAQFYTELARHFQDDIEIAKFWLNLALNESNLANVLGLFRRSDFLSMLSDDDKKDLEQYRTNREGALLRAQRHLAESKAIPSLEIALRWALEFELSIDPQRLAFGYGMLFQNLPAATAAYMQTTASHLNLLAQKALLFSQDPQIQQMARDLQTKAGEILHITNGVAAKA